MTTYNVDYFVFYKLVSWFMYGASIVFLDNIINISLYKWVTDCFVNIEVLLINT